MAATDEVRRNLDKWARSKKAETIALAQGWAGTLQGRAKRDRKWHDRTSLARKGLKGTVEIKLSEVLIRLSHSVEYGVYLELANDGRFAVLKPTMDAAVPEILSSYQRMMKQ